VAEIELERLTKVFPGGVAAVDDVSLSIGDGEFVVLVGPSGCGKSTLLRMIAGLEEATAGRIEVDGRDVTDLAPRRRDIAMVFQTYALYPHMSVRQNIGYGLKVRRTPKAETKRRVEEVAALLGLEDMLERRPAQLSGGQRQRVAMGRAIVREPKAFLMDEPLSNLDAKLRVQMRAEIARIQQTLKVTTLYVTHDQVEAMTMGDRVAVMRDGVLQQVDDPQRVYDAPANLFVASFLGSPPMNLFEGELVGENGSLVCRIGSAAIDVPSDVAANRPALPDYVGRRVALGIRPEDVRLATHGGEGARIEGSVLLVEALGPEQLAHVEVTATPLARTELVDAATQPVGGLAATATVLARFDRDAHARPGDRVELDLDPRRLHFFDLDTGSSIHPVDVAPRAAVAP
jgi:multiple sugar transport system ATP-binding protein